MSKTKYNNNNNNSGGSAKTYDENDFTRKDLYNWKKTTLDSNLLSPSYSSLSSTRSPLPTNRSNKSILLKPISIVNKTNQQNTYKRNKFEDKLRKKVNDLSEIDNGNVDELLNHYKNDFYDRDNEKERPDLEKLLNPKKPQNIEKLDLSGYNLNDIINVNKFLNLKSLDLSCNYIQNIQQLHLKNLSELKLYGNQIEIVQNLESLAMLSELQLQSNKIKCLDNGIGELKNLKTLRLDHNKIQEITEQEISSCLNLTHVNVSENQIKSLVFINCLPNLQEFIGNHMCLEKIDFDTSKCKKITELDLSHNTITDDALESLEALKSLLNLNISNNLIKSIKSIVKIKSLRYLNVSSNLITFLNDIKNLTLLEVLDASNNQINELCQITSLVHCKELVELEIHDNPIMLCKTEDEITSILTKLQYLNHTPVNDANVQAIGQTRLEKELESNLAMENDFIQFEKEMNSMNDKFLNKFNDISKKLTDMERKFNLGPNTDVLIESSVSDASVNRANSAGFNRLTNALSFSKIYAKPNDR